MSVLRKKKNRKWKKILVFLLILSVLFSSQGIVSNVSYAKENKEVMTESNIQQTTEEDNSPETNGNLSEKDNKEEDDKSSEEKEEKSPSYEIKALEKDSYRISASFSDPKQEADIVIHKEKEEPYEEAIEKTKLEKETIRDRIVFSIAPKEGDMDVPLDVNIELEENAFDSYEVYEGYEDGTLGSLESEMTKDGVVVFHIEKAGTYAFVSYCDKKDEEEESTEEEENKTEKTEETASSQKKILKKARGVKAAIEDHVITSNGDKYKISVTYDSESEIPANASLHTEEITKDSKDFKDYEEKAKKCLGDTGTIRLFDITILDEEKKAIQPAEGKMVKVQIELENENVENCNVLHFGETTEVLETESNGESIHFETSGFSVYAVVEAPPPEPANGWNKISTVEELMQHAQTGLYISHANGYFMTNTSSIIKGTRKGINKTKPATDTPENTNAVLYYFEPTEEGRFYIYCLDNNGNPQYVRQVENSMFFDTKANANTFLIERFPNTTQKFRILGDNGYYWNMQGGTGGKTIAAFNNAEDENAKMTFHYYYEKEGSPYDLDGKSFGIAWYDELSSGQAITAEPFNENVFKGQPLTLRPNILSNDGVLLLDSQTDVQMWTFEYVRDDKYYIKTNVEGVEKYLSITSSGLKLLDTPDPATSEIRVMTGSEEHAGKFRFYVGNRSINMSNNLFASTTATNSSIWMNLVERSEALSEEDFVSYRAKKVNVSDTEHLKNGQKVVIYTRIWNKNTLKYDYYAIDHNGSLLRCYDSGDSIVWIGGSINTALWDFEEHYYEGTNTPSYYYDLKNEYSGKYIAPQLKDGQILSDEKIGLNLNGRRYGDDYTTIIAWDDAYYEYVGLGVDGTSIDSVPLSQAKDFFFAIIDSTDDPDAPSELTTVNTVDNNQYGISMKMIDFNNSIVADRDSEQTRVLGRDSNDAGLVQTHLEANGYPLTNASKTLKPQVSLSELFSGATPVNHLFLLENYEESGYFEYDSTQNFAHLGADNNFVVYNQLGAIGAESRPTRVHGQFMPYNDLTPGLYYPYPNSTSVLAEPLPDLNPRKGELMYQIPQANADYFFGMEMTASFVQTESGLDAWGHDIVFEFSGDDDFWLYVDDELVLDLGGVHSAMVGSINFRTGQITGRNGTTTTLYDVFRSNYITRNPSATTQEITDYLNNIFTLNDNGQYVFQDYTNHTMKMFYMERGAGASNLKMRFNLAAANPGTVTLSKKISGTSKSDYALAEFPYQLYYCVEEEEEEGGEGQEPEQGQGEGDGEEEEPVYHLLEKITKGKPNVTYKGKNVPVKFLEEYTPSGSTVTYSNVFFLKPGETCQIHLPEGVKDYYITECAVNSNIYDHVKANNVNLTGVVNGDAQDYSINAASIGDRPKVVYDNHVSSNALRTLTATKVLYAEDGHTVLTRNNDPTTFNFRLYLGKNTDTALSPANMQPYRIKDEHNNYCVWDNDNECFVPTNQSQFNNLTEEQKEKAVFITSINGSISKIPAGYSVEVPELLVGTKFKLEERADEIPEGYEFKEYDRINGSYIIEDGETANQGTIRDNSDPYIAVKNQRGWGLTVNKEWSDTRFMQSHDPIYFAVYVKNGSQYTLLNNSVKQMPSNKTSLYYFFGDLQSGIPFHDYYVYEVNLTGDNIQTDQDGNVTGYDSITRLEDNDELNIGGTPIGGTYHPKGDNGYDYVVSYQRGDETTQNENVRNDTVKNTRPGISIYKEDSSGDPLGGAIFTLKDSNGDAVTASSYTSAESNGLITYAYLNPGTYTLEEISTPNRYYGLPNPVTINVDENKNISISGIDSSYYRLDNNPSDGMSMSLIVKNFPKGFQIKKIDYDTEQPMSGVKFALYRQVTDSNGHKRKDYYPITGFENMSTDAHGVLTEITGNLSKGTYYLTELETLPGYNLLSEDLCFSIDNNGNVSIVNPEYQSFLTKDTSSGHVSFVITIPNQKMQKVEILKKNRIGNIILPNAAFKLFRASDFDDQNQKTDPDAVPVKQGKTNRSGILDLGYVHAGEYRLVETAAPSGYQRLNEAVVVNVGSNVTASYESETLGVTYSPLTQVWQIPISNTLIDITPPTGNIVKLSTIFAGLFLILLSGELFIRLSRKKEEDE